MSDRRRDPFASAIHELRLQFTRGYRFEPARCCVCLTIVTIAMRKFAILTMLLGLTFFILVARPAFFRDQSIGLEVNLALAVPCSPDLIAGEIVQVLRPGVVRLH